MDKGKERGILKLEPRPRIPEETRCALSPQGSWERAPTSPQPSVDRLSVTWADVDPPSMSSGANFFLPADQPTNEVKFSPAGDGSDDEDYSASLSAVLRQRRASSVRRGSVRRSRKNCARRASTPDAQPRRRSSVFTTSSGDTAISMEDSGMVTQEQIFENIHLHKEVLGSVKQQPLGMRRKLKIVHQAKAYIKRHEGQLQERLAQSKSTRDIYARLNILLTTRWQQLKREAANMSNLLIPWELRIKEIESHFGSVVASYFTFLRWLFWVNLVIGFILLVFVIVPEYLTANPQQDGERKIIMSDEQRNASNFLTLWEFEGILKVSPIFYGYYSNIEGPKYRMPLAYFLTGLVVYIYSFVAILRKMAENSRMSKLSEKEDECIFSWKLFTGWDFMIGNAETAHNRIASVILGFKEALLEEAEKKKDLRNWRTISLRALVNICVMILLGVSAYAVVTVVTRSDDDTKARDMWRENETTIVVTVISITFPYFFDILGLLEHHHPRKQLRLQLARIMLLNLLNLYSLIFALFNKIDGMGRELDALKPTLCMNASIIPESALDMTEKLALSCLEVSISCTSCNVPLSISANTSAINMTSETDIQIQNPSSTDATQTVITETTKNPMQTTVLSPQNLMEGDDVTTTENVIELMRKELEKLSIMFPSSSSSYETSLETSDSGEIFYDYGDTSNTESTTTYDATTLSDNTDTSFSSSTSEIDDSYRTTITENSSSFDYIRVSNFSSSDFTSTYSSADFNSYNNPSPSTASALITPEVSSENTIFNPASTIRSTPNSATDLSGTYTIIDSSNMPITYPDETTTEIATPFRIIHICPNITFNCTISCGGQNVTQVVSITNCTIVEKKCYVRQCRLAKLQGNLTVDYVYLDEHKRKMYNLTTETKKKLLKLCWETMFGQELVKLTNMDLVFVLLGTLFMDFFRALFVRYMNRCWCWDLEKRFPEYGDFKIAENILHLINNQGMVWMGMFFSPGLVVLNVLKLIIMMYLRSWTVMTCNVPHAVVFRVSKSNNFYLALLLTMLFLCVLPVGYTIVWVRPSWHCGPFSEYDKIYYILTSNINKILPKSLKFAMGYIASPAIVIPLLVLLILIIYYLTSLTNSLREANNDLKVQLRRERTEERRKMFQLADTRRRGGSSAMDNTPFARWKKALPALPISKSIDSDERKTSNADECSDNLKTNKRKGGSIFAKIVSMALDKKSEQIVSEEDNAVSPSSNAQDDETDTDFHETLPKEVLKIKDITITKHGDDKKVTHIEAKHEPKYKSQKHKDDHDKDTKDKENSDSDSSETPKHKAKEKQVDKQTSETSAPSKQDSIGSVIPVITISTTESDDEILHGKSEKGKEDNVKEKRRKDSSKEESVDRNVKKSRGSSELKSLRRQSSVDSTSEHKVPKAKKPDDGHKFQHSL